eukprot:2216877-Pyramimonas_sp.AAC.1
MLCDRTYCTALAWTALHWHGLQWHCTALHHTWHGLDWTGSLHLQHRPVRPQARPLEHPLQPRLQQLGIRHPAEATFGHLDVQLPSAQPLVQQHEVAHGGVEVVFLEGEERRAPPDQVGAHVHRRQRVRDAAHHAR